MPKVGDRFNPHRVFSGVFVPDGVYTHQTLSSTAKLIYGRLCKYKGERGDAYPAGTTLAAELGISERQVFDHLSRLVDEKFIVREPRMGTSTVYHFLWHPCFDGEHEVVRKTALPKSQDECGNPHHGSAENRTGGSAENRIRSESIEVNQGSEDSLPTLSEEKDQHQSQNQLQPPTHPPGSAAPPSPTLDEIDPESGEPYKHPDKKYKKQWSRKKEPKPSPVSDRLREMREGAGNGTHPAPVRLAGLPTMSTTPPPSAKPVERIFEDWNLAVPERPVDRSLFPRRPDAFNEAFLFERFPEVCEKARILILAGADLTFGFLMTSDKSTGQYRWQQLLAGQLEWMKPKSNGKPDHKPPVDGRAMAAELREQIKQRKEKELAARTEAKNQESGRPDL